MLAATCHPEKESLAKGLCKTCYHREHKRKQREDPENRAKFYAVTKAWHKRNPEYERERSKRRYKENPEKAMALIMDWWKRHPEKRKEYRQRLKTRDIEAYRAKSRQYVKARKARKKGAPVCDFTAAQWEAMKREYNFMCVYCNTEPKQLTQDHMIPLSRGGAHTEANVVPACMVCNTKKGTRTPEEYLVLVSG